MNSAKKFYTKAQELSVPLVVLSRFAVRTGSVPRAIFDVLASHCGQTGKFLCELQRTAMQDLWRRSCAEQGSDKRGSLPARCTREWFLNSFCGPGSERTTSNDDVWPHIVSFNAYSPLLLLFALPGIVKKFTRATSIKIRAATHLVIGVSTDEVCVPNKLEVQKLLIHGMVYGARCNVSHYSGPVPAIPIDLNGARSELRLDLSEESLDVLLPPVHHN
jgi:hypothetical protein